MYSRMTIEQYRELYLPVYRSLILYVSKQAISPFASIDSQFYAVFKVATAVELGRGRAALEKVREIDVDSIPARERQARYLIDVARANMQESHDGAALRILQDAYSRAPEYVSHHVMVREAIVTLLGRERKSSTPGLRTLAKKTGVL